MKPDRITGARVIVCSPGRNFVTIVLQTEQGLTGLGDATLNGREKAVAAYLEEHCLPCLVGRNAAEIEDIWQFFYRGAYWKRGPVTMTALAAIDMALWDIKGKTLGTPVYNLLGGRSRDKILVYAHANGRDITETVDAVVAKQEAGYLAVRAQTGIPGLADTYGVSGSGRNYEPAVRGKVKESVWETEKYLNHLPRLFEKLRLRCGEELHLLHDAHHRCTPIEAARLARELEPYHLFWLEDAVSGELQEGLRLVRRHSVTPLAIGEVFNTVYDYTTLISEQLIDYIRMPPVRGGGISHLLKVAAFAGIYHIKTGFHGATDLSPVNLAAALHLNTAIHNFGILEHMPHQSPVEEVFRVDYRFENGYMHPGDKPGLGVELDEKAAARFPYERAFLPVNRKPDGTMFNW